MATDSKHLTDWFVSPCSGLPVRDTIVRQRSATVLDASVPHRLCAVRDGLGVHQSRGWRRRPDQDWHRSVASQTRQWTLQRYVQQRRAYYSADLVPLLVAAILICCFLFRQGPDLSGVGRQEQKFWTVEQTQITFRGWLPRYVFIVIITLFGNHN